MLFESTRTHHDLMKSVGLKKKRPVESKCAGKKKRSKKLFIDWLWNVICFE